MDIGTIIGIFFGLIVISAAIIMGGGGMIFISIPSVMITMGGTVASTLINFPLPKILGTMRVVRTAFKSRTDNYALIFRQISDLALRARRDGILALEDDIANFDDEFMRKGFQMAVDGNSADIIRHVLEEDMKSMQDRHAVGHSIFRAMANYAPAFGMIGTLIGLINMLRSMDDPASIGMGMAVALLTTLYGALIANLICTPIAGKLEQRTAEEVAMKMMVLEGILAIQEGNSPRVVQEKLRSYMAPSLRQQSEVKAA
ncbi:MAG: MotA/TolQ/ExbB proton channel family protein [Kiritimatiellae bacterium]|nr:MotA/TolQ/ExbB proton channel family protein [Kiritimatiellia bacterium]